MQQRSSLKKWAGSQSDSLPVFRFHYWLLTDKKRRVGFLVLQGCSIVSTLLIGMVTEMPILSSVVFLFLQCFFLAQYLPTQCEINESGIILKTGITLKTYAWIDIIEYRFSEDGVLFTLETNMPNVLFLPVPDRHLPLVRRWFQQQVLSRKF